MEKREPGTTPELAVRDVSVSFGGIRALDGVSVEVSRGEVLGIIGPNGAGKTTLFNVICGFVTPDSGSLCWHGETVRRIRPDRLAGMGIARTLQGVGLFPRMTHDLRDQPRRAGRTVEPAEHRGDESGDQDRVEVVRPHERRGRDEQAGDRPGHRRKRPADRQNPPDADT